MNIYYYKIDSSVDLEKMISSSEEKLSEVSESLLNKDRFNLEEAAVDLNIADLLDDCFQESFGLSPCIKFKAQLVAYKDLLHDSISICDKIVTPLIIAALKCHQRAFHLFPEQEKFAIEAMVESTHLAKTLTEAFEKLGEKLDSISKEISSNLEITSGLLFDCCKQEKESGDKIYKRGVDSLLSLQSSEFKILVALQRVKVFWRVASINSNSLASSKLDHPFHVEVLRNRNNKHAICLDDFEIYEKYTKSSPSENATMKTGSESCQYNPTPFTDFVRSKLDGGVDEELDRSFFDWLVLAKVNLCMIKSMKDVCESLEVRRLGINLKLEDPLAKAVFDYSAEL